MIVRGSIVFIYVLVSNLAISQTNKSPILNLESANMLAELPLACIGTQYPNKPGMVLSASSDLAEPKQLHPSFYGCFDWHSAVHGHWSLVRLLKSFPELEKAAEIRNVLKSSLTTKNIEQELDYFENGHNYAFERTYGWAWLLKLQLELEDWKDPLGQHLAETLKPLADKIADNYLRYIPKLNYAIRVGEHTNTAFGLCFAWDYAKYSKNDSLMKAIDLKARSFYLEDKDCPIAWEPGGSDFLSPCLEELDLMRRILTHEDFSNWVQSFLPILSCSGFDLDVGEVSDRTDGKLVHLDGLNFSRAWVIYGLTNQYPEFNHLQTLADKHIEYSLPNLISDSYAGGHWLGTFAIYALYLSEANK